MAYQFHIAVIPTEQGKVRLLVRESRTEAVKDAEAFCNGHRAFEIIGLTEADAMPKYLADRQRIIALKSQLHKQQ